MAIFNLKYIQENYNFEKERKPYTRKNVPHLNRDEILNSNRIIKSVLNKFPKLKKCCDFVDLNNNNDIDRINDNGEYESSLNKYYNNNGRESIEIINGDVLSGYPDFRSNSASYEDDSEKFVKEVNKELKNNNIKARVSIGQNKDDESISFEIKSVK